MSPITLSCDTWPVLKNGRVLIGVTIRHPGWVRFAVLEVDVRDFPLREMMLARTSTETPTDFEPDMPTLPLW